MSDTRSTMHNQRDEADDRIDKAVEEEKARIDNEKKAGKSPKTPITWGREQGVPDWAKRNQSR